MRVSVTHRLETGAMAIEKTIEVTRVGHHEMAGISRTLLAMASRKPRVARKASRTTPRRKR